MCEPNLTELNKGELTRSLPSVIDGWENGVKKWPCITYSGIFKCFVESIACVGKAVSSLKRLEVYQYIHRNKVSWIQGCWKY